MILSKIYVLIVKYSHLDRSSWSIELFQTKYDYISDRFSITSMIFTEFYSFLNTIFSCHNIFIIRGLFEVFLKGNTLFSITWIYAWVWYGCLVGGILNVRIRDYAQYKMSEWMETHREKLLNRDSLCRSCREVGGTPNNLYHGRGIIILTCTR